MSFRGRTKRPIAEPSHLQIVTASTTLREAAAVAAPAPRRPTSDVSVVSPSNAHSSGKMAKNGILSLVDQGIVSATSFLTVIMLGRTAEKQLGVYQLGFSAVVMLLSVQSTLISVPYSVFGNQMQGPRRARYAGSTMVHQWMLSICTALATLLTAMYLMLTHGSADLMQMAWVLVAMLPCILLREFIRRFSFAHLQLRDALWLDAGVAVLQIGGLIALSISGSLTAARAFAVIGLACAIAGGAQLFLSRRKFVPITARILPDMVKNWSFGKWLFAAQISYAAMGAAIVWILAYFQGEAATGRFAACNNLIMIANPVLQGIGNFLGPQLIQSLHTSGVAALNRLTMRATAIAAATVGVLVLGLMVFGSRILGLIYGPALANEHWLLSVLALNVLMFAVAMGTENALMALGRPRHVLWSNVLGLVVTLLAGASLIPVYGGIGAAVASVAGLLAATGCKIGFYKLAYDESIRSSS